MTIELSEEEKKWADDTLKRNIKGIRDSAIFMQLWDDSMLRNPLVVMQLGLAIMMDKPIHIAVPFGAKLPENLRKVAASIEYYDGTPQGVQDAARKILKNANMVRPQ